MEEKLAIDGGRPVRDRGLQKPYPGALLYGDEERRAVLEVIDSRSPYRFYGPAPLFRVQEFEGSFARRMGSSHVLAVTSGTAALIVALKAAGIGPGDKVVVPANTFLATPGAVLAACAVPVFADIDESLNLDPAAIEPVLDRHVKAVLPVHIGGNPCDMDPILEVARRHGLAVIEDVAQSCGCSYRGRPVGTLGDLGAFSLQINKVITSGDGGAVTTDSSRLYERAVRYHDQGMFREREGFLGSKEEEEIFPGQNYRMSELTGAVALAQLGRLDAILEAMRRIKAAVLEGIRDVPGLTRRRIVDAAGETGGKLALLLPDPQTAKRFRDALNAENVTCSGLYEGRPVYMIPQILTQKTVEGRGFPYDQFEERVRYEPGMCPACEGILPRVCMISITPDMDGKDAENIAEGIRKVSRRVLP